MARASSATSVRYQETVYKRRPALLPQGIRLLSVLSFIYRYLIVFPRQGNLGFDGSAFDWATMFCHTMLSSSSLIFRVLKRRIASKPMVITQDNRLHAIVTTLRCLAVFTFGIMKPFVKHDSIHRVGLMATVLFWHLCADEITRRFGPEDKSLTTVRVNQKKKLAASSRTSFYASTPSTNLPPWDLTSSRPRGQQTWASTRSLPFSHPPSS